jgi:alpha-glucosidase
MDGPEQDRNHRDPFRAPMIWDAVAPFGGFSTAPPWLQPSDPPRPGVSQQRDDPASPLALTRAAIALRRDLGGAPAELLPSPQGTLVLRRRNHVVAVNLGDAPQTAPALAPDSVIVVEAHPRDGVNPSVIPAHGGWVARLSE